MSNKVVYTFQAREVFSRVVDKVSKASNRTRVAISKLEKQFQSTGRASKRIDKQFQSTSRKVGKISNASNGTKLAVSKLGTQFRSTRETVKDLNQALKSIGETSKKVDKRFQFLGKTSKKLGKTIRSSVRSSINFANDKFKSFLKWGTIALSGLGVMAIKSAANFEDLEISFGVMLKSTEKAKKLIGELEVFAAKNAVFNARY